MKREDVDEPVTLCCITRTVRRQEQPGPRLSLQQKRASDISRDATAGVIAHALLSELAGIVNVGSECCPKFELHLGNCHKASAAWPRLTPAVTASFLLLQDKDG